ncbi:ATP synthase F1 subunit delta [Ehrlichia ruminantium]|uniref:ATP synthase subunit delta n=1 Tax=Ehrlichia ruminantium TaxID=779 RepID=A0AAE6Q8J3_EHRRU|nr:ATP synthase F1 subunit delta [Ehrlichia ruminantium]QGR02171.1 ATP synthase F1 subunit delta [Ehrlichia ruminantium]QGR03092.1 ATP synthase F1 subunit delta [Ehrlichia ruminantium]QGR04017.1 ATP synthase F1 subunit delta [Ehrlichia ruminantium]
MTQYRGGHVASCYAQALFNVSVNKLSNICEGIKLIISLSENSNNKFFLFLSNPTVSIQDKTNVVELITDQVDITLIRFILVVIKNNRGNMLLQIFSTFLNHVRKHKKEVSISVTSCTKLTKQEEEGICNALLERYGKVVSITNTIDPSILGGFIIKIGFDIIDISLNSYLQSLQELSKIAVCSIGE